MRARLVRLGSIIEAVGFDGLPGDTVKHLEDKLWELRIRGRDGIARAICLFDRREAPGGHRPGVRQEDSEDAQA